MRRLPRHALRVQSRCRGETASIWASKALKTRESPRRAVSPGSPVRPLGFKTGHGIRTGAEAKGAALDATERGF